MRFLGLGVRRERQRSEGRNRTREREKSRSERAPRERCCNLILSVRDCSPAQASSVILRARIPLASLQTRTSPCSTLAVCLLPFTYAEHLGQCRWLDNHEYIFGSVRQACVMPLGSRLSLTIYCNINSGFRTAATRTNKTQGTNASCFSVIVSLVG